MVERLSLCPISPFLILPLQADHEGCIFCSSSEGKPGLKVILTLGSWSTHGFVVRCSRK